MLLNARGARKSTSESPRTPNGDHRRLSESSIGTATPLHHAAHEPCRLLPTLFEDGDSVAACRAWAL